MREYHYAWFRKSSHGPLEKCMKRAHKVLQVKRKWHVVKINDCAKTQALRIMNDTISGPYIVTWKTFNPTLSTTDESKVPCYP